MRRSFVLRVRLISVFFLLVTALLLARLYYVQIILGDAYRGDAESQYIARGAAPEDRHVISFTDKVGTPFAAALMESGYRLAIHPDNIVDPDATLKSLSAVITLDRERFMKSAARQGDPYEEVAFHIDADTAERIRSMQIPGVTLISEKWRIYPFKERAAHVLGFVGYKGDERVGRYGLERYWEDTLRKQSDGLYVNFFAEVFSSLSALSGGKQMPTGDVITSIEPTVEQHLEETIGAVAKKYHSKLTGGIVMDPRTGSILALAAYPTFDPNTFNTMPDSGVFGNPLVESVFEFGSIMKPLTMAAGIDSGVITLETVYNDTGCITRDDANVCNYDGRARGRVNMQEVLNQSLNTGAAFVAEKIGKEKFAGYMFALGLGEETGIDLPGEVPGITSGLKSGSALDLASASFGQGVAMTPIAMARALSSLSRGLIVTPHVADRVRLSTGVTYRTWAEDERRVFSEETADIVTRMLITVVDKALIEGKLRMEHYTIAAKTGTAQMAKSGGGYYADRYLHSFFGYFPAHDPQFLIFLFTVEPQGVNYASQTLAEPFGELAKFLISYYDVPPDR